MEPLQKRIAQLVNDSLLGMAVNVGSELKLFDALAEVSSEEKPATSAEVAEKADLKERYVREWLCCVACGGFVEVDKTGKLFWIKKENVRFVAGKATDPMLGMLAMVPHFGAVAAKVKQLFKKDGPLGLDYSEYKEIHRFIDLIGQQRYKEHLLPNFLPLTGMKEKLEKGSVQVLDVGCGTGYQCAVFAKTFPRSHFIGIDNNDEAMAMANKRKQIENLTNLEFEDMNAAKLPEKWAKRFDWVTIFDAYHDQMRPDLSLKEIHRVLKDDGVLTVVEVKGSGNAYIDRQQHPEAALNYGVSLFHCLPVGSNSPDALCLGAMWGQPKATKLLRDCGFEHVEAVPTPFFTSQLLYVCRK